MPASRYGTEHAHRPSWRTGLLLLATLGLVGVRGYAGAAEPSPAPRTEVQHAFKGNPESEHGWERLGPNADACVRFQPDGLRITLPAGWGGERPSTGVCTHLPVQGDFEITMGFEILQEPEPAETGAAGTRVSLGIFLDTPRANVATLSRSVGARAGPVLVAWSSRWNSTLEKPERTGKTFPSALKAGQLRLVRSGSELSYYAADGAGADFTLLQRSPFGPENLKEIRLAASTGGPRAGLDVRITDLRIRAASLPATPVAVSPPPAEKKSGLAAGLFLGLVATLALLALGAWLIVRRARRGARTMVAEPTSEEPAQPDAGTRVVSFVCPDCGQNIRARGKLAGKKVRCPQCARAVHLPESTPAEPGSASG